MPSAAGFAILLSPILLGLLATVALRRSRHEVAQLRGIAVLLPFVAALAVGTGLAHAHAWLPPTTVNRSSALAFIVLVASFAILNAPGQRGPARTAVWLVTVGATMNAAITLVVGYMPVLEAAAARAGYQTPLAHHPTPKYVLSDDMPSLLIILGDFIPVPGLVKVISLGDVLLFAGTALMLALLLSTGPRRLARTEPEQRNRKEVNA